jgi:uroporphyrinogen decarboxylase
MNKKEELTSRERVRLALEHKETDRVPIAMVCSGINPPANKLFNDYLKINKGIDLDTYLDSFIDIKGVEPDYVGPSLQHGEDIWGVIRKPINYGAGEYDEISYYPLAKATNIDDIMKHRWPTTDYFDYSVIPEKIVKIQSEREHCLMFSNGNIFETSWYMRGFEKIFMDLVLNPEMAHTIFSKVTDFYITHFIKMLSMTKGKVDLVFTADDIGGQNGLLMSLEMWEKFIKPYHKKMNKVIHNFGAKVIYHSDGAVMNAVKGLIDMGIDILQALQFDAKGMDPKLLKERFGTKLCFEGGVSVQSTLPFKKPEDVKNEVIRLISILGKNGGYILGPSHAIQAGTPPENIMTMFETALNFRL